MKPKTPEASQGASNNGSNEAEVGACVVTVTVVEAGWDPSMVREEGEAEQLVALGAPLQVTEIGWVKPAIGVTASVNCAFCPGLIVADPGDTAIVKLGGVGCAGTESPTTL